MRLGTHVSDLQYISTGSPQGCVFSPLLLYQRLHIWSPDCPELLKFADDTTGKVYNTVVRPAMLYGLETVSLRKRQESELEVAELKMLRFSLGVTRLDRIRNEYIRGTAHVGCLGDKVREARLRWFGHVQRRETEQCIDVILIQVTEMYMAISSTLQQLLASGEYACNKIINSMPNINYQFITIQPYPNIQLTSSKVVKCEDTTIPLQCCFQKIYGVELVNIAVSLLIANICFIIGAAVVKQEGPCSTATFFMHFFYLALFFWMLLSALLLLYRTIMVFSRMTRGAMMGIGFTVGYGAPLIIAVITVASTAGNKGYIQQDYNCWLNWKETKAVLAFVVPALTIVAINLLGLIVVLCKILRRGVKASTQPDEKHPLVVLARCVVILTPLFGLTWGFGIGTMVSSNFGIHVVFAFLNSLQGFFILLFGTLLDIKVREALARKFSLRNLRSSRTRGKTNLTLRHSVAKTKTKPKLGLNMDMVRNKTGHDNHGTANQ
ncbi:hypothetical protein QTP70_001548 [Hemibagrus guttatus]|uniref:G-protein coupled receptors family 2 profile 2 domain-containing protein n=1 Tax=Hemibagrus guttatus TaxID=175788 RepID=A0AAE0UWX8_9TELE|nr:hypothetical protein QTP70_001548 [Hemibagrus guttatus]